MSLPTMTGVGRLTDAPDLKFTSSGKAVCKVRLAFNSRRKNPQTQEWEDGDVYYVDGSIWDQEAENVAASLDKGHEVLVTGRLKTRKYETQQGEKRSVTELAIESIAPTMKFATVKVAKLDRSGGQPAGASGGGSRQSSSRGQNAPANDPWGGGGGFADEPPFAP